MTNKIPIKREKRCVHAQLRAIGESRVVEGHAILFDSPGYPYGDPKFEEVIERGAVTDDLISTSDVLFCLEHDSTHGLLGRSRNGKGTLALTVADEGLSVKCELPKSAFGDQVLEGIRRGDYYGMSFCFSVAPEDYTIEERADGSFRRTITKISGLYDVSVVSTPAYDNTDIQIVQRSSDKTGETSMIENNNNKPDNMEESQETQETQELKNPLAETQRRNAFTPRERRNTQQTFSLVRILRSVITGESMHESDAAVCQRGISMMRDNHLAYSSSVIIPVEFRAEAGATIVAGADTHGAEAVSNETMNMLGPLYNNLVLRQAGAKLLTGLTGNFTLPYYTGSTASWEGETDKAKNGKGDFGKIEFSPKRLTTYIDISNQFILQDSANAEALLREDLAKQIQQKLEATLLGAEAGSNTIPEGIFYNVEDTITPTFAEVVSMEQQVEEANAAGNLRYIMNPAVKAALRTTSKEAGSGVFLMNGSDVNGIPALVSNASAGIILGNFSEYVIGQWGGIEIITDKYALASEGMTRITINSYWDAKPRRGNVFAKALLK